MCLSRGPRTRVVVTTLYRLWGACWIMPCTQRVYVVLFRATPNALYLAHIHAPKAIYDASGWECVASAHTRCLANVLGTRHGSGPLVRCRTVSALRRKPASQIPLPSARRSHVTIGDAFMLRFTIGKKKMVPVSTENASGHNDNCWAGVRRDAGGGGADRTAAHARSRPALPRC